MKRVTGLLDIARRIRRRCIFPKRLARIDRSYGMLAFRSLLAIPQSDRAVVGPERSTTRSGGLSSATTT